MLRKEGLYRYISLQKKRLFNFSFLGLRFCSNVHFEIFLKELPSSYINCARDYERTRSVSVLEPGFSRRSQPAAHKTSQWSTYWFWETQNTSLEERESLQIETFWRNEHTGSHQTLLWYGAVCQRLFSNVDCWLELEGELYFYFMNVMLQRGEGRKKTENRSHCWVLSSVRGWPGLKHTDTHP